MAARIAGVNIPVQKHTLIALQAIYGIGNARALKICKDAKINPAIKVKDLSDSELDTLRSEVSRFLIEGDLRRERSMNVKRKIDLGAYGGIRHRRGLPLHGQRTRSNARTRKGKRKPIRSG